MEDFYLANSGVFKVKNTFCSVVNLQESESELQHKNRFRLLELNIRSLKKTLRPFVSIFIESKLDAGYYCFV